MQKTRTHFEQVPIAVVEKILEQQSSSAKPDGDHKIVIVKSKRAAEGPSALPEKVEVLTP
jgi:hypothetical protein